jgi:diguanylate cyclase (GGDEF)-like protein
MTAVALSTSPSHKAFSQYPAPLLTTVRQAHVLPSKLAAKRYPVHFERVQITDIMPKFGLFVMDSTDGIFVWLPRDKQLDLHQGDIVTVDGVSGPGDLASVIEESRFRVLGHQPLPPAPSVSLDRLTTGAFDSRWVTLDGIVRSVTPLPNPALRAAADLPVVFPLPASIRCDVRIASGAIQIDVLVADASCADHRNLVDTKVRLQAVAAGLFNQRKELIGVRAFMQDFASVRIEEPALENLADVLPSDKFALSGFATRDPGHRVRVRGVVTATWGSQQFTLMTSNHGIFVYTDVPIRLAPGDDIDLIGFPSWGNYSSVLEDSDYRRKGSVAVPQPVALTAEQALRGDHDAEPVQIDGQLLNKFRTPSEENLIVADKGIVFVAALPPGSKERFPANLEPGSSIRVTGICAIESTPEKTPKAFKILLQSPASVTVLQRPNWWTLKHAAVVVAVLGSLMLVILVWLGMLRRRVHQQTQVIADQLKRLQHQATHDNLTGLLNRDALFSSFHNEMERTRRSRSSVGLLMIDIDHFKAINDAYGHLAGDDVLRQVAQRISETTRPYDIAGRYGGEEFLLVLPGCDGEQTLNCAERIRTHIHSHAFRISESEVNVSISLGGTVATDSWAHLETEMLSIADEALYEAKHQGRNRTVFRAAAALKRQPLLQDSPVER